MFRVSIIPSFTLSACCVWGGLDLACGPSHCSAPPWHASHDTPSDRVLSSPTPTTWHTTQRRTFVASILRTSAMRFLPAPSSTLCACLLLSPPGQEADCFPS